MKTLILAILAVGLFQVNLAAADQYVYADGILADLDEPTTEVADSTDNNVDSTSGFADGKRVISTNQSAEFAL